ncbi:hypothetical protein FHQ28_05445 [Pasteurellaceae bacterium USgator11]|nr:hypothetical protein FHQ19_09350 [Pasteurellaceae bacterium UScroc12]TNG94760.1 hypothetical protein FHQ20_08185 [Pasteurellaceae bacterium USgator41]TNG97731.1 hypothetical protein FHQ24_09975 [Pasteurellaceae bacterium UScroc31]TNH01692.1 hypothetical protein FHQ28_05445 [Pasteurellaceae bacterium USgator11]
MANKFIIIVDDDIQAAEEDKITKFLQAKKSNFWHWVHNVWLINDEQENFTIVEIRESIKLIHNDTILVFRVDDGKLSGYAPTESGKWLRDYWNEGKRYNPEE